MTLLKEYEGHELNHKHLHNPEPGDYWHEMFVPILVVLSVTPQLVTVCEKTIYNKESRKSNWNLNEVNVYTRESFIKLLSYSTEKLRHKTYCDVVPLVCLETSRQFSEMVSDDKKSSIVINQRIIKKDTLINISITDNKDKSQKVSKGIFKALHDIHTVTLYNDYVNALGSSSKFDSYSYFDHLLHNGFLEKVQCEEFEF